MRGSALRLLVACTVGGVALACAPAVARRDTSPAPARDARRARTATLDSTTADRLCVAPDRVAAGRAPCVLRDQRPLPKIFTP